MQTRGSIPKSNNKDWNLWEWRSQRIIPMYAGDERVGKEQFRASIVGKMMHEWFPKCKAHLPLCLCTYIHKYMHVHCPYVLVFGPWCLGPYDYWCWRGNRTIPHFLKVCCFHRMHFKLYNSSMLTIPPPPPPPHEPQWSKTRAGQILPIRSPSLLAQLEKLEKLNLNLDPVYALVLFDMEKVILSWPFGRVGVGMNWMCFHVVRAGVYIVHVHVNITLPSKL